MEAVQRRGRLGMFEKRPLPQRQLLQDGDSFGREWCRRERPALLSVLGEMVIQFGCRRQSAEVAQQASQAGAGVRQNDWTHVAALQSPGTDPQTQVAPGPAAPVELKKCGVVQTVLAQ